MIKSRRLKTAALALALCIGSVANAQNEPVESNYKTPTKINFRAGGGVKRYNLDFPKSNNAPFLSIGASAKTGFLFVSADYSWEVPQLSGTAYSLGANVEWFCYTFSDVKKWERQPFLEFAIGPRYQFDNVLTDGKSLKSHSLGAVATISMVKLNFEFGYLWGLNKIEKSPNLDKGYMNTFYLKCYLNIPTQRTNKYSFK